MAMFFLVHEHGSCFSAVSVESLEISQVAACAEYTNPAVVFILCYILNIVAMSGYFVSQHTVCFGSFIYSGVPRLYRCIQSYIFLLDISILIECMFRANTDTSQCGTSYLHCQHF